MNRADYLEAAVLGAIADAMVPECGFRAPRVLEADDSLTKVEVERIVRRYLAKELDDSVLRLLKKELKASTFEDAVVGIVSRALAKFHEIMFTRRSTWQNQLKKV